MTIGFLHGVVALLLASCAQTAGPKAAEPPASAPSAATRPAEPATTKPAAPATPDVGALLDKLEKSSADLNAFTARMTYEKFDQVLNRKETRAGEIIYQRDLAKNTRRFAALFDTLIVSNRKSNRLKHYIFDGRWLAEIDHQDKQFIKREIVPPGKTIDPLKLGEGPFPLPIGQKKADVLARFDVTSAELPTEGLLKDLKNVDGLLLVPKPESKEAKDFTKVVLFYDRQTLLPVGISTLETNLDRKTIRLDDAKRNPPLDEATLKKLDIQEPGPAEATEWHVDVQPWAGKP